MGLVPDNPLGRVYRDILGRANSIIAHKADQVFMMISGIPLKIKG
jgi:adenosylcobinamide kinase/adenosylcobinamide-phosphate guanylyltransferase